jgi:hypothetical protein
MFALHFFGGENKTEGGVMFLNYSKLERELINIASNWPCGINIPFISIQNKETLKEHIMECYRIISILTQKAGGQYQ